MIKEALTIALSKIKTWIAGEVLTASDLNAEFSNIVDNGRSVVSPLTGSLDMDGNVLVMDSDADTTITADTDDRIDYQLSGTDLFRMDGTDTTPVNGLTFIARATGSKPSIQALTSDANEGLDLRDDNGNEIVILSAVASAVNEITITNAATGSAPVLQSSGEANIGLDIQDSNSNEVLTLASTASAVNEITITNNSTTNAPSISATGGDTNISINLVPKGSGVVQINGTSLAAFVGPRGYIDGLILSNDTDTDHDINITAGVATNASEDKLLIRSSEFTKQIDATWSAGDDAGGLSSSLTAPANDTWYHVFLIEVGGSVDAGFDTSVTAANLVADHSATDYRRIGSVLTDGSANIIAFFQYGDRFVWDVPVQDVNSGDPGVSAVTPTLTVPTGVGVDAILSVSLINNTATSAVVNLLITATDQTDTAPSNNLYTSRVVRNAVTTTTIYGEFRTDTSAQIRGRVDASGAYLTLRVFTHGWIDPRGRDG